MLTIFVSGLTFPFTDQEHIAAVRQHGHPAGNTALDECGPSRSAGMNDVHGTISRFHWTG